MRLLLQCGSRKGEIHEVPPRVAQVLLADGRATPVPSAEASLPTSGTVATTEVAIDTRDPKIPSGRHHRGRR
ncbi:MAG: hypothetical protein WC700_02170 [Gemmatimonadaceae bacterium]|jgi:hypothetical protein